MPHASCNSSDPILGMSSHHDNDADDIYEIYEIESDNEQSANATQYEHLVPSIDSKLNIVNDVQPVFHAPVSHVSTAPMNAMGGIGMSDNRSQYLNEQFPQGIAANESKPAIGNIIIHEDVRLNPNQSFIREFEADTTSA